MAGAGMTGLSFTRLGDAYFTVVPGRAVWSRSRQRIEFRMAEIELSAAVANRFASLDWSDRAADPSAFDAGLIRHYEAGDIVLLRHPPFSVDFEVLNRVSFPAGRAHQKLTDRFLTYPKLYRREVRQLFREAFGSDVFLYRRFRREVKRLSEDLRRFACTIAPSYRFLKQGVSWRFTPTGPEGLHVDYFRRPEDLHYFRIFINVDLQPRVWTVGPPLPELIARFAEEAGLGEIASAQSNQVCHRLNKRVFDRINAQPRSAMDRHTVRFAPGDVWLCETRLNSHEIFSGHRLVATDFYVDPASMQDPSRRVDAQVEECLRRAAAKDGAMHAVR